MAASYAERAAKTVHEALMSAPQSLRAATIRWAHENGASIDAIESAGVPYAEVRAALNRRARRQ